jgi:A/G-specific adenine glycosylase
METRRPALNERTIAIRQEALLTWFGQRQRQLPWRATREGWLVMVSEIMLQQTQVSRVLPKYLEFVERFPDAAACATASCAEVITMWSGLGYNRRARMLHATACALVERHDGVVPESLELLLALPGIGPYTARAVLAFAHERDVGVVDTNAARVLARAFAGEKLDRTAVQQQADAAVPVGKGWQWNQAMLDLGATVCTKRAPQCGECPLVATCVWKRAGDSVDPADGTAGVSTAQSKFDGSDRQGRGRIVRALREQTVVNRGELARVAGWPDDGERADRVARSLLRDGLVELREDGSLTLPVVSTRR